jgi:putative toxin-antitoxin system antitoxin component (TIGR02293 family)
MTNPAKQAPRTGRKRQRTRPNVGFRDPAAVFDGLVVKDFSDRAVATAPAVRAMPGALDALRDLGYSAEEINALVVPRRTLARRTAQDEPLSVEETDKAMRLERIAALATQIFGQADKANGWLRKPKRQLEGETPLAYLRSETGARIVEDMLRRIEHGILA